MKVKGTWPIYKESHQKKNWVQVWNIYRTPIQALGHKSKQHVYNTKSKDGVQKKWLIYGALYLPLECTSTTPSLRYSAPLRMICEQPIWLKTTTTSTC